MTAAQAGHAASLWNCVWQATLPTGDTVRYCVYNEGPNVAHTLQDPVGAYFLNGRVGILGIVNNRHFITTTGITAWTTNGLDANHEKIYVPGSTPQAFVSNDAGATCPYKPYNLSGKNVGCDYEAPATRFTFVVASYEACTNVQTDEGSCYWPAPDYYVRVIGVATQKAYDLARDCVLEGQNCPPGLLTPAGNVVDAPHPSRHRDTTTAARLRS